MPRRRKKKELVKIEWRRMPEVEAIVDKLVTEHHQHLARAKIVVLGKPKAGKRGHKANVAKASKASAALNALVKDEIGEVHYQIAIGLDAWDTLSPARRRIVLDHELMHFAGQDEAGRWTLVGHDVEAFAAEIRRGLDAGAGGLLPGGAAAHAAPVGMNILALDLATRTGWALSESGRIESGVDVFDVRRGESPGTRYLRFNRWLEEAVRGRDGSAPGRRVDLIIYEQSHHRGGAATEVAAGFTTRVQECCARHQLEHIALHSATLKKWTTGKGNADKAAMLAAVQRRWRATVTDDNEADAIALLHYALGELVGSTATAHHG